MIRIDIQKRFADVDMLGHVNNVNLQHYFDVGKNDFFARVLEMTSHLADVGLISASTTTSYIEQTRMEDPVHVQTFVEKLGNKSLTLMQRIVNSSNGVVHVESHSVMVAYDFGKQISVELPDWWRGALSEHYV